MEKADTKRPDVPPAFSISYSLVMMNFRTGVADMGRVEGMAPRAAGVGYTTHASEIDVMERVRVEGMAPRAAGVFYTTDASEIDGTGVAVMEAYTVGVDGTGVAVMETYTVGVDGTGS